MILAALYFLVLIASAILLALLWLAYRGVVYLWRQAFRPGERGAHNEAKDAITVVYKGLSSLWR